jgi:3D (Asp-Asp-Asp) domain-containing protein
MCGILAGHLNGALREAQARAAEVETAYARVSTLQDKNAVLRLQKAAAEREAKMLTKELAMLQLREVDLCGQIQQMAEQYEELKTIPAVLTGYAPLDPDSIAGFDYSGDPNITATGTQVRVGVGAADFKKLPAGTVLAVPGYGEVTIEDTGSAMRAYEGVQIDLVFASRAEALRWGRKELDVTIVSAP